MTDDLRPSQIVGVDFLSTLPTAILADDTGLGKSAQAIRAADKVGAKRILILCQPIGRVSWAIEAPKWQTTERQIVQFDKDTKHIPAGPLVLVAAYSSLSRVVDRTRLKKMLKTVGVFGGFDLVILDEAHHLAHPKSARTKAAYGNTMDKSGGVIDLVEAPRVWLLSATLQRSNASELFAHLRALFPAILASIFGHVPTHAEFIERVCRTAETPYGTQITGNDPVAMSVLREAMRPFILRRVKRDVAKELGEVQHVTLPLPIDPKEVILAAREDNGTMDAYLDALDAGLVAEESDPPGTATLRRHLGHFKAKAAVEWIEDFLEANPDRKLIVFAHHTDAINLLVERLGRFNPSVIDGRTPPGSRQLEVRAFQEFDSVRLFIGQTVAAGTSITLTAAHDVLLLEPEGVPADNHQAIGRADRIGQTQPVTAYYAYAAGTSDERYAARAKRRAADFDHFFQPLTTAA